MLWNIPPWPTLSVVIYVEWNHLSRSTIRYECIHFDLIRHELMWFSLTLCHVKAVQGLFSVPVFQSGWSSCGSEWQQSHFSQDPFAKSTSSSNRPDTCVNSAQILPAVKCHPVITTALWGIYKPDLLLIFFQQKRKYIWVWKCKNPASHSANSAESNETAYMHKIMSRTSWADSRSFRRE